MEDRNTEAIKLSKRTPVLESVTFRFEDDFEFTLSGEEFRRELAKVVEGFLENVTIREVVKHIFGKEKG